MRQHFRFFEWCQSRQGATALLLVIATGMLVGYYGWLALLEPPTPTYYLDFGAARWIQASEPSNNVCFRKNIYLSETPKYAWLQVAGIDGFRLTVNSKHGTLDETDSENDSTVLSLTSGGNQSVICDITHYLSPGTNTIAVNVTRSSFPGRSKLLCRGGVINQSGQLTEFFSDKSWRVALTPGTIPSLITWTNPEMDDARWAHAEEAPSVERSGLTQPVTLPPVLLQQPIKGKWITDERPGPGNNTIFRRCFDAPGGNTDTWLQVAANGDCSVVLNGHFLGDYSNSPPLIQFLNLKRWMKPSGNDLSIQVRGLYSLPTVVAEISFLDNGARASSIVSDHDWLLPNSRFANAIGSYNYWDNHWGFPPKMDTPAELSSVEATHQEIRGIAFMLMVATVVFLGWIWSGTRLSRRTDREMAQSLGLDGAIHLPALIAAAALLLLRYDIRFRPESPLRVEFFLGLIVMLILPRLLVGARRKQSLESARSALDRTRAWTSQHGFWLVLGVIVLGGFVVRLHGLTTFPLDQDDILIRNYAQGILKRGYPSLDFYGFVIPVTSYELLPYPIAISCLVFGWSDWAVLLPALMFGTLTILLLGLMGRNLFNWQTGLAAALIYAFNPYNVFWAQHCFHPSQTQFFALLTIWSFYLAIRQPGELEPKYFYGACLCFCLTYLSWEGSGFLLPVLAGSLLVMHPGRWSWLRQRHLWIGLIVVGSIVLIELSMRKMGAPGYIFLGYGLALLKPSLYFLNQESDPFFYVSSILITQPHVLLSILCMAGALFVWRNVAVRYCLVVFTGMFLCFSLFLPVYSVRYFYFYQTLLILTACGVFFLLWDRIRELTAEWQIARVLAWGSGLVALLLILGTATETGLKVFRLSEKTSEGRARLDPSLRYDVVRQDTRGPAEFVASRLRPGDIVLANLTQAFYLYGRRMPDYALNTELATRMIYFDSVAYRHRFVGIPMVRNFRDMQNIFDHARRVWYIGGGSVTLVPKEFKNALDFVTQRAKIVYSTYHAKVYLWDGTVSLAKQTVVNPALPPQPSMASEKPTRLDVLAEEPDSEEASQPLLYPPIETSSLYPQWTHQKISEPDPSRVNAKPKVQPLQPTLKPEKPDSDENAPE